MVPQKGTFSGKAPCLQIRTGEKDVVCLLNLNSFLFVEVVFSQVVEAQKTLHLRAYWRWFPTIGPFCLAAPFFSGAI